PVRVFTRAVNGRVLHRDLGADVRIDPLHRSALFDGRALGHEVVHVVRPVLDRRVADLGVLLHDDFHDGRVQRVRLIDRGGAALDVVNRGAFVGDDERALELPHVLGVDPEVGLQRDLHVDPGRDVHERPTRPHGGVEGGERVVTRRNDRAEVLLEEFWVLTQRRVGVDEDYALALELLVDLVIDDFDFVLGRDTGNETLLLHVGDTEPVEGVLDLLRKVFPRGGLLLSTRSEEHTSDSSHVSISYAVF